MPIATDMLMLELATPVKCLRSFTSLERSSVYRSRALFCCLRSFSRSIFNSGLMSSSSALAVTAKQNFCHQALVEQPWHRERKCAENYNKYTHTHTHTRLTALFPGLPGWAGTRKVNESGFYWSERQWVAVASAGPYASLHLAPDR